MAKTVYEQDSIEIQRRRVKSYLDTEVLSYAKYVIETRAMPALMDGLRVGARKIIWAALTGDLKKSQKIKMPSLIGDTMKLHYNHGDASLLNTIVQLSSTHIYKYAPLEVIGQIGSLRIPKCDTAPRYMHIKKRNYIDFFKQDFELLNRYLEDGDLVEPKYFLPIIPLALLIRTNSPGFGFSFRSFSYDINDIIDNCIKAIINGTCTTDIDSLPLTPCIEGISPDNMIFNSNKNSWFNVGNYHLNFETDTLTVTDLPYDVSFEKYDEHLQNLQEKNYIVNFTDYSQDDEIKYVIKFARGRLKTLSNDKWKFFQTMKLFSKVKKDTLNCIDQDGKTMLFFDTPNQLIDTFVRKRMIFYSERKVKTIAVIKNDIKVLSDKIKFIRLVTEDKLIINKRPISDIKSDLDSHQLPYDVLKLNIDKLTADEIRQMEADIVEKNNYLTYIENSTTQDMYLRDLVEFKQKYCDITVINK